MSRARRKGEELRRRLGLRGQVDAEAVANAMGLEVVTWPFEKLPEMLFGDVIGVATRLDSRRRRWAIAHAIGHARLHPGNHLWIRSNTGLAHRYERDAEDFAYGLLFDEEEAKSELLNGPGEAAEYFGIPESMIAAQMLLRIE